MRCLFVVQGEGRGHMTQAIALRHMIEDAGHTICGALVGTSPRRQIPSFFLERVGVEVDRYPSPNFIADGNNRGVLIGRTFTHSLRHSRDYLGSLRRIGRMIDRLRPDLIVNFYEPLFGVYQTTSRATVPSVTLAHQCLSLHPGFPFTAGHARDRLLLRSLTRVATSRANVILGLSFTPMEPMRVGKLHVVPPILRPDLFEQATSENDYLLVYIMSDGYGEDILAWHRTRPGVPLHCFWDRKGAPETDKVDDTLTFHQISDTRFLSFMAGCKGLVTTAGFESVCEAMYLGKPVLMVPVQGHYEQLCNAIDGERAGAGVRSDRFDLDILMNYLANHSTDPSVFRGWVSSAPERIVPLLEITAKRR